LDDQVAKPIDRWGVVRVACAPGYSSYRIFALTFGLGIEVVASDKAWGSVFDFGEAGSPSLQLPILGVK